MSSDEMYPCLWDGPGTVRGLALVLNYEFTNQPGERKGSEKDVENLSKVLKGLGYEVCAHNNLSHEETQSVLDFFMDDPIHGADTTDSTVVVVMSHGSAGNEWTGSTFQTEDGHTVASQPVIDRFQTVRGLKGKPKIFFFNFCRGPLDENLEDRRLDENVLDAYWGKEATFWTDGNAVNSTLLPDQTGRPFEDTLIAYSTLPRFVSYRGSKSGSCFIQMLCQVLGDATQVAQKPLGSLLLEVDKLMADKYAMQTPETLIRGFNKNFYFISFHKLRKYYLENVCRVMPLPWYPDRSWNIEEVYTELSLENMDELFPLEKLFQLARGRSRHGGSYRILIEGDPGYEKTSLMLRLASDWAKRSSNDYMSQFRLVLFVKLGGIGSDDIEDYILDLYQDEFKIPVQPLLKGEEGARILILLDGYDEASAETKKFVGKVMTNRLWSQCHVVLTSRFGHVTNAIKANALRARLKGFGRSQVALAVGKFFIKAGHLSKEVVVHNSLGKVVIDDFRYVQQAKLLPQNKCLTPDRYRKLMKSIIFEPYIQLAQCPLLCAMLCCWVGEFPERELPSTLTELYFAIINRNLYRARCKKAEMNEEDVEEWNWSLLRTKFPHGSEEFLKEFGTRCLNYLKSRSPRFTLFELTGKSEDCKANDARLLRLVEAGVLIKSTDSSPNSTYHPTHRTMAEFLAAYYLTAETDREVITRSILELSSENRSAYEVCVFCYEMQYGSIVADSFRDIKLSKMDSEMFLMRHMSSNKDCNGDKFWLEIGPVLDGKIRMEGVSHVLGNPSSLEQILQHDLHFLSAEICFPVIFRGFIDSALAASICRLLQRPLSVCLDSCSIQVKETIPNNCHLSLIVGSESSNSTVLFPSLADHGVLLGHITLICLEISEVRVSDVGVNEDTKSVCPDNAKEMLDCTKRNEGIWYLEDMGEEIFDSANLDLAVSGNAFDDDTCEFYTTELYKSLEALFKSASCPDTLEIGFPYNAWLPAMCEGLKDPPEFCKLKRIIIIEEVLTRAEQNTEQLMEVLAKHWIPERLEELALELLAMNSASSYEMVKPVVTSISSSTCLSYLTLTCIQLGGEDSHHFLTCLLGSQLKQLTLWNASMTVNGPADLPKSVATCRLRSLHLHRCTLRLKDAHLYERSGGEEVFLEELVVDHCRFPSQCLDWLGASVRGLRSLELRPMSPESFSSEREIDMVHNWNTLKKLSVGVVIHKEHRVFPAGVTEAVLRCRRLDNLVLRTDEDRSTWNVTAVKDCAPLIGDLVGMLRLLELKELHLPYVLENRERRTVCEALANLAHKWPGKHAQVSGVEDESSLTLKNFPQDWAALAVLVFRERNLNHRIKFVAHETYEIWFPTNSAEP